MLVLFSNQCIFTIREMKLLFLNILIFFSIFSVLSGSNKIGDICKVKRTKKLGKIKEFRNCKFLNDLQDKMKSSGLQREFTATSKIYKVVKKSSVREKIPWYCCPLRKSEVACYDLKSELNTNKISDEIHRRQKRIIHGNKAFLGEFPFFAALAAIDDDNNLNFNCGGALIASKYILTAAHCINQESQPPIIARLGIVSDDATKKFIFGYYIEFIRTYLLH